MSGSADNTDRPPPGPESAALEPSALEPSAPEPDISAPAVARLAAYLHVLRSFSQRGVLVTSSGELATAAGVNAAILRKDLSAIGASGVRGVGYDVGRLTARIALVLHTDTVHTVALAGAGRLGQALLAHAGVGRGFRVAAMFDDDPALIGTELTPGGPRVAALSDIAEVCGRPGVPAIEIGVIATAEADAERAFAAFTAIGVRQVLNVTPVTLSPDSDVVVRQVDLALELQVLAFAASRSPVSGSGHAATRGSSGASARRGPGVMGEETVTA